MGGTKFVQNIYVLVGTYVADYIKNFQSQFGLGSQAAPHLPTFTPLTPDSSLPVSTNYIAI